MTLDASFVIRFILSALALYRVAMFTREDGPFGVFEWVSLWLGRRAAKTKKHGLPWTLAEIANCPHCIGVWLAILVVPAVIWPSRITDIIIILLALAGLQSRLTERGDE